MCGKNASTGWLPKFGGGVGKRFQGHHQRQKGVRRGDRVFNTLLREERLFWWKRSVSRRSPRRAASIYQITLTTLPEEGMD